MATGYLLPVANSLQVFTDQGVIGSGYKIQTYVAGTTTPVTTYTSSALTVATRIFFDRTSASVPTSAGMSKTSRRHSR